jgi:O-acetylserine/cysteine efflux transporter
MAIQENPSDSGAGAALPPMGDRQSIAAQHLAFMLLVNVVWGLATVATKVALGQLPPIMATAMRFSLIGLVLLPVLRWQPGRMRQILAVAITAGGVQLSLFYSGLAYSSGVASTAILGQLGVPFSTILSIFLLGETVRWRRWGGIILAFSGTMVLGFDPRVLDHPLGAGLVLAATFVGASSSILMRRLQGVGVFQLQAWIAVISAPILIPITLMFETGQWSAIQAADTFTLSCIAYTALASSLVGHGGMYFMLQRYPVSLVMPLTLLAPFLTVVFGIVFLGEALTLRLVLGGAITFIGVLIITLRAPETARPTDP